MKMRSLYQTFPSQHQLKALVFIKWKKHCFKNEWILVDAQRTTSSKRFAYPARSQREKKSTVFYFTFFLKYLSNSGQVWGQNIEKIWNWKKNPYRYKSSLKMKVVKYLMKYFRYFDFCLNIWYLGILVLKFIHLRKARIFK